MIFWNIQTICHNYLITSTDLKRYDNFWVTLCQLPSRPVHSVKWHGEPLLSSWIPWTCLVPSGSDPRHPGARRSADPTGESRRNAGQWNKLCRAGVWGRGSTGDTPLKSSPGAWTSLPSSWLPGWRRKSSLLKVWSGLGSLMTLGTWFKKKERWKINYNFQAIISKSFKKSLVGSGDWSTPVFPNIL